MGSVAAVVVLSTVVGGHLYCRVLIHCRTVRLLKGSTSFVESTVGLSVLKGSISTVGRKIYFRMELLP